MREILTYELENGDRVEQLGSAREVLEAIVEKGYRKSYMNGQRIVSIDIKFRKDTVYKLNLLPATA